MGARGHVSGCARDGQCGAPGRPTLRRVFHGSLDQSAAGRRAADASCSGGGTRLACHRSVAVGGNEDRTDRRTKPKKGKAEAKRPLARKSPKDLVSKVRDLEKRLADAHEQQTATGEILRVISRSRT